MDSKMDCKVSKASWCHLFVFTTTAHSIPLLAALIASCSVAGLKVFLAVVLGKIFDVVAEYGTGQKTAQEMLSTVSRWCIVVIALATAVCVANAGFLALWLTFGELQAKTARKAMFESLLKYEIGWFDSLANGTPSLLVAIQTQIRELQLATSQVMGLLVCDSLASMASLGLALYFSWKLSLVLIATVPPSMLILSLITRNLDVATNNQRDLLDKASKTITSAVSGVEHVKIYNAYEQETGQYMKTIKLAARQYFKQAKYNALQMGYVNFWVVTIFVAGFWYGLVLVDQGLSPGSIITTFFAVLAAIQGIEALLPQWLVFSKAMAAASNLATIQKEALEVAAAPDHLKTLTPFDGSIDIYNVSFAYPTNPTANAIERSSFCFPAGKTTFIVGPSGSGKSTVGYIIANLYEPSSGGIYYDGCVSTDLDKMWLRNQVTLVEQFGTVFMDSVFNNITIGLDNEGVNYRSKVSAICKLIQLDDTINSLNCGLDSLLGTSGVQLSGGQKQRISLARALIRDPKILVLDEPTSALDQDCRKAVMNAIKALRVGKTTIIITHDLSNIERDDFLYVMDAGKVVQKGFRKDLAKIAKSPFEMLLDYGDNATQSQPQPQNRTEMTTTGSGNHHSQLEFLSLKEPDRYSSSQRPLSSVLRFQFPHLTNITRPSSTVSVAAAVAAVEAVPYRQSISGNPLKNDDKSANSHHLEETNHQEVLDYVNEQRNRFSTFVNSRFTTTDRLTRSLNLDWSNSLQVETKSQDPELKVLGTQIEQFKTRDNDQKQQPNSEDKTTSWLQILLTIWPCLQSKVRLIFIGAIIACILAGFTVPMFAYCLAKLLSAMWSTGDKMAQGKPWALYLTAVGAADGAFTFLGRLLFEMTAQEWVNNTRSRAVNRILRQPMFWFRESQNSMSQISDCLDRNSEEMRNIVGRFLPIITTVATMVSASFIWALAINWRLSLVVLAPTPLVIGLIKVYSLITESWETKCNEEIERSNSGLMDVFTHIKTVYTFALQKHFTLKYEESVYQIFCLGVRKALYSCFPFGLYQSFSFWLTALVFYYGAWLLTRDTAMAPADIIQVMNLLLFSIGTATEILSTLPQLTMAKVAASQLLEYTRLTTTETSSTHHRQTAIWTISPLPIRLNNLDFAYQDQMILKQVSMEIVPGQITAIVGSSGCGKSTLLSLLLGLYPPTESQSSSRENFTFSGVPYNQVDINHLRRKMGYVSQDPYLFPTTIAENIAYGLPIDSPYRQQSHIRLAAAEVGMHEFIESLAEGYNTVIGDGGQALSGGQAQRLNIARAIIRRPTLLVLDEPTSALDAENTRIINQTLHKLISEARAKGNQLSIILATHNVEMMRAADIIVMMSHGQITDRGTISQLISTNNSSFQQLIQNRN